MALDVDSSRARGEGVDMILIKRGNGTTITTTTTLGQEVSDWSSRVDNNNKQQQRQTLMMPLFASIYCTTLDERIHEWNSDWLVFVASPRLWCDAMMHAHIIPPSCCGLVPYRKGRETWNFLPKPRFRISTVFSTTFVEIGVGNKKVFHLISVMSQE